MKPRDIEKLYSVTFRKSATDCLLDFWESGAERIRQDRAVDVAAMNCPDFGWATALKLVVLGRVPATLKNPDFRWLRKAGVYLEAPQRMKQDPDLAIIHQATILHDDSEARPLVQAALLTRGASAESVATALGIEPQVVEAFDALFFNVLDRKTDLAYIRNAVRHALTRRGWVYMAENVDEDHCALLNAGLNGSLQDVLYLAGCGRACDETDSPAENLMQTILAAGSAWIAANRGQCTALPPIVSQAIEIAKKTTGRSAHDIDPDHQSTGTFNDIVSAQFELDVKSLNEEIARATGLSGAVEPIPMLVSMPRNGGSGVLDLVNYICEPLWEEVTEINDGITFCTESFVYGQPNPGSTHA